LAYIPEPTRDPSLRTRPRLISYGQAISLRKRTRIFTGNPDWWARSENHRGVQFRLENLESLGPTPQEHNWANLQETNIAHDENPNRPNSLLHTENDYQT
jgi:hypothetical protein